MFAHDLIRYRIAALASHRATTLPTDKHKLEIIDSKIDELKKLQRILAPNVTSKSDLGDKLGECKGYINEAPIL
jgi:hypothetical protein